MARGSSAVENDTRDARLHGWSKLLYQLPLALTPSADRDGFETFGYILIQGTRLPGLMREWKQTPCGNASTYLTDLYSAQMDGVPSGNRTEGQCLAYLLGYAALVQRYKMASSSEFTEGMEAVCVHAVAELLAADFPPDIGEALLFK